MSVGQLTFGKRTCEIRESTLTGTLRPRWPTQWGPESIEWCINIQCKESELFEGYLIEPTAVFAFTLNERIHWKQMAPAILAEQNDLYGSIYFHEHFDMAKGLITLQWLDTETLDVSCEFEGEFELDAYGFGRLQSTARWGGIRLIDIGEMTVEQAVELMKTIFDTTDMTAERTESRLIDGRSYADIFFKNVQPKID
ncbi:MAG: hypothetical protein JNK57_19785 [Planctomycetaceae bacterium]|nr:hypothetical protein [Planctomycetaceae bacterium]